MIMKINIVKVLLLAVAISSHFVLAKEPLRFDLLNQDTESSIGQQQSISQGYQQGHRQHYQSNHRQHYRQSNQYGYQAPWRWGTGWNNHWGPNIGIGWSSGYRWGNDWGWRDPWYNNRRANYDYDRNDYNRYSEYPRRDVIVEPVFVTEPTRTTTSIQYDRTIKTLPENARVIQLEGKTLYEWQGIRYVYDWSTERYVKVE
ncbi:hypothetical protein [Shewanella glacialimarina]|uniref:hypothetical protein n=1 Tax=Shewanella glacialimarina TaxID=2590884 RepID=UPI001CF8CA09|nr:hypothetical protein [Shewanella glacialimarina]UCX06065.1 hypothetical protein FJ709_17145 [Shewanella glacialimarina]